MRLYRKDWDLQIDNYDSEDHTIWRENRFFQIMLFLGEWKIAFARYHYDGIPYRVLWFGPLAIYWGKTGWYESLIWITTT